MEVRHALCAVAIAGVSRSFPAHQQPHSYGMTVVGLNSLV